MKRGRTTSSRAFAGGGATCLRAVSAEDMCCHRERREKDGRSCDPLILVDVLLVDGYGKRGGGPRRYKAWGRRRQRRSPFMHQQLTENAKRFPLLAKAEKEGRDALSDAVSVHMPRGSACCAKSERKLCGGGVGENKGSSCSVRVQVSRRKHRPKERHGKNKKHNQERIQ